MSPPRYCSLIVNCLATAPDQRATTGDLYEAVARHAAASAHLARTSAVRGRPSWQHTLRNAMKFLERKGVIRYLGHGQWGLGEADWRPWASGLPSERHGEGQGHATADHEAAALSDGEAHSVSGWSTHALAAPAPEGSPLGISIAEVAISTRLKRRLLRYGAQSLEDVLRVDERRFARMAGVGRGTMAALRELQAAIMRGEVPSAAEYLEAGTEVAGQAGGTGARQEVSLHSAIADLVVPTRLRNCLRRSGCITVADVLSLDTSRFAEQRGVGTTTLAQLRDLRAWLCRHVAGAGELLGDDGSEEAREERDGARVEARRALRVVRDDPAAGISAQGLAAITRSAPAEGPIASLSELLREVIQRPTMLRSREAERRDLEIWLSYYGIRTGKPRTLEVLARRTGLSRERVRQIIARVSHDARALMHVDDRYTPHLTAVREVFASSLGVMRLEDLAASLQRACGWSTPPTGQDLAALAALLKDTPDAFGLDDDSHLVRHSGACQYLWPTLRTVIRDAVMDVGEGQHLLDFAFSLGHRVTACARPPRAGDRNESPVPCCGARAGQARLPGTYVAALLSTIDPCPLFGDTVLRPDWACLRSGRIRKEVVIAALRVIGKPVHYGELAQFVRAHNRYWQRADDRSIHACLTSHDEFVLTQDLGVYGLREWGVRPYLTAADRVEAYLRQRGRPAPIWQIVAALEAEGVPESNVRASFGQHRFTVHADGTIGLSEWAEGGHDDLVAEYSGGSLFSDEDEDSFIMG